ncbi:M23 family metallopeptidase [Shumkonia mesophila]|uniref:M23 family metallopeptidase n=1 Tax=Shumkonia mesophila TaxID=2838854 RepID=UPI002934125B|nr:M23 family metallopeptidase [Shumkonia mesophila]
MIRPTFLFAAALLLAVPGLSAAAEVRFDGNLAQGGLAIGHADPGSSVTVNGRAVRVSADGEFLLGFDRDAPASVEISIIDAAGARQARTLAVARRDFPVQRIDGLPPEQVTPDPKTLKRINEEAALVAAAKARDSATPFFRSGFVWPVAGRVSGVYGSQRILNGEPRAPHGGVDIAAPKGAPVMATADGTVSLVQNNLFFTGKTVMIDHGFGLASVYAHLDTVSVHPGQTVAKGAPIGTVGASGRATGPHLHWGVSLFEVRLDPALLATPVLAGQ